MHLDKTRLFPIEPPKLKDTSDFVIEADGKIMFTDLILLYIDCKLQIIESNSWASENIQRENLTNESLRKIDEIEEEKLKIKRKEKIKNLRAVINSPRYKNAYSALEIKYFPIHWKVFFTFCKHGNADGVYILIKIISRIIGR